MSRPKRICLPGVTYYVTSRCHNLDGLMAPDVEKDILIEVINMTVQKYQCEIISYTITDTHIFLIIRTIEGGPTISRIMQFIKSQFARRYNRKMNRTGAFWNERFSDTIIEHTEQPESYFHWLVWDMGYAPVQSGLVGDPRTYTYSSILSYLDENHISPIHITLHEYFIKLGASFHERVRKFLEFETLYKQRLVFN